MILFGVEMRNDPVLNEAKQIDQNFTAGNVLQVYDPTTRRPQCPPTRWASGTTRLGRAAVRHHQQLRLAFRGSP